MDDADKWRVLLDCVHESDVNAVANCGTLAEALEYLKKNYASKWIFRELVQEKIGQIAHVQQFDDNAGLRQLKKQTDEVYAAVRLWDSDKLFDTVYSRLPTSIRLKVLEKSKAERSIGALREVLEEQVGMLLADEVVKRRR